MSSGGGGPLANGLHEALARTFETGETDPDRLATIVAHAPIILAELDTQGRYVMALGQGLPHGGLRPGDILDRSLRDAWYGHPQLLWVFDEALRGQVSSCSLLCAGRTCQAVMSPVIDADGQVRSVVNLIYDVSEPPGQQTGSEARMRDFARVSGDWLWETDAEHRFVAISKRFRQVLGLDPYSLIGRTRWDLRGADPADHDWDAHIATLEAHKPFRDFRYCMRDQAGRRRVLKVSGVPVFDADGEFCGYRGIGRDITAQVEAEEALRESEGRFRSLVTNLRNIIFCRGVAGDGPDGYDSAGAQIYGIDAQDLAGTVDEAGRARVVVWYEAILPEDRPAYLAAERARKQRHIPYTLEYRIRHPASGEIRWMREVAWAVEDATEGRVYFDSYIIDITEQKQREAALTEAQARLADFVAASSDWLWETDAEHRFTAFSDRFGEILGIDPADLIGRRRWERTRNDPADLDWEEHKRALLAHEPFRDFRFGTVDSKGRRRVVQVSGVPVFDAQGRFIGHRGVGRDVTAQIEAQEALRESEDRFRSLVTNLRNIVFVRGAPGGGDLGYSDGTVQLYGLDARQITKVADERGRLNVARWIEIVHPEDLPAYREAERGQIEAHEPFNLDYRITDPETGEIRWIREVAWVVTDPRTDQVHFDSYMLDITEQKAREAALDEARSRLQLQAEEMRALAEEAQRSSQAKSAFLAMMSHEIRTPMNGVLGALGLLVDRSLSHEDRQLVETARQSAEALLTILNDILDYTKVEAGKLELETMVFSVSELVRSVIDLCSIQASAKGIRMRVRIAPEVSPHVRGDAGRVRQMLLNYVTNAVKFTARGTVTIEVAPAPGNDGEKLRFQVDDTGPGIPPERAGEVFRDFTQLDSSVARRFGGTGLGLAITKRLAGLMGGSVGFTSRPGKGATFWFDLVLPAADPPAAIVSPQQAALAPLSLGGRRPRILLVEDNRTNQMVAQAMLDQMGCAVDTAGDGLEAIHAAMSRAYDVILMDISMPIMDGIAATGRLRAEGLTMPIIALTATVEFDAPERIRALGFTDYLVKPAPKAVLHAAISRVLGEAPPPPAPPPAPEPAELLSAATLDRLSEDLGLDTMLEILRTARSDLALQAGRCAAAIKVRDPAQARRAAHALSGIASSVGALSLGRLAQEIETGIDQGREPSDDTTALLQQLLAGTLREIDARLG